MSEKNESRDWELTCDHCDGSGHVFVERQVAERKTDVQEFKEECECCEGRGFTIAFEDIPGIAEYVRKSRPAPSAPRDAQDECQAFEAWFARRGVWPALCFEEVFIAGWNARPVAAPAAGDARKPDFARAEQIAADFVQDYEWRGEDVAGRDTCYTPNKRERAMITDAILGLLAEPEFVAALAAQVPHKDKGEA